MKTNVIQSKSYQFALAVMSLYKVLIKDREYIISRQLLKSATSIGANIEEALAAQSRRDFISKMNIALKEARETRYWLKLLRDSHFFDIDLVLYLEQIEEIIKILASIVKSSKENNQL
jgi:four helix bundle protein